MTLGQSIGLVSFVKNIRGKQPAVLGCETENESDLHMSYLLSIIWHMNEVQTKDNIKNQTCHTLGATQYQRWQWHSLVKSRAVLITGTWSGSSWLWIRTISLTAGMTAAPPYLPVPERTRVTATPRPAPPCGQSLYYPTASTRRQLHKPASVISHHG